MRLLFAFIILSFSLSCEKECHENSECKELPTIFISANNEKIKEAVTEAINSLSSQTHTEENLRELALALGKCGVAADILCYGCIKTLPEQSELRLSITDGTQLIHRTIDISATSTTDAKMKFVAIHE